jgi:flagellar protein FlbD
MIKLTKLSGKDFILNAGLIETVESNPDTTLTLTTGKKFIVKEPADEVVRKTVEYKRGIYIGETLEGI